MSEKSRYRLYIDESGDHGFNLVHQREHRYLALLGIWFEVGDSYNHFAQRLQALKDRVFSPRPDDPICLHRMDIVYRKGPFGILRNPELASTFDRGLLELVTTAEFVMTCVLIDKKEHGTKTYRRLFHPYHYSLAVLLERYAGWLEMKNAEGDVMAESRGRTEDRQLREAFGRTYGSGTQFHSAGRFQRVLTSKKIKLKKKQHNIPGLQLADLLAHPVRREMIAQDQKRMNPKGDFGARLVEAARSKFNRHTSSGKVTGYGKVFLK